LLLCLFFLPAGVQADRKLTFLWQAAPALPGVTWHLILWTFSLGVLAALGGLLAAGSLLGVILAGGVVASFVFALAGPWLPGGQSGVVVVLALFALMFFLATLRLRRMFYEDSTIRLLVGVTAGAVFLTCLLPIKGEIALQHAIDNIRTSPAVGPVFAGLLASFLALLTLAPRGYDTVCSLSSAAEAFIYLGLLYMPVRECVDLFRAGLPGEFLTTQLLVLGHTCVRVVGFLILGKTSVVLLLGLVPGLRVMRAEAASLQPSPTPSPGGPAYPQPARARVSLVPRASNVVIGLVVAVMVFGAAIVSFVVADRVCRGSRAGLADVFTGWRRSGEPSDAPGASDAEPSRAIIGKWREVGGTEIMEFSPDGTVVVADKGARETGRYTFLGRNRIRLELGGLGVLAGPMNGELSASGDELAVRMPDGDVCRYRKVR